MNNHPLLSIVVPTKDRYQYLKPLITLIDSFQVPYSELELLIQDNTVDNEDILSFLASKQFPNIAYFHEEKHLSVAENSDHAINNSNGQYICVIGDDDGVTKHIVNVVKWMQGNGIEALLSADVSYYWPEYINSKTGSISSSVIYKPFTRAVTTVSTKTALERLMKRGFVDRGELPLAYHGIVKRTVLDKIYAIGQTYFPGASPDIANGVALALLLDTYTLVDLPVIIPGASKFHGGGIRAMKNKAEAVDKLSFLPANTKERWEKNIPLIWTGETIWAESAIKALRYMNREDLIQKVNFEYLYASFIVFHYPLRNLAYKLSQNKIKLIYYIVRFFIRRYYKGGIRLLAGRFFGRFNGCVIRNITDINEAAKKLTEIQPTFHIE
jgi:glycosyltransferase involved in cell wall biosynthesis